MAMKDNIIPLIGQLIAAISVIATNSANMEPVKAEQKIINIKITGLSEKVSRIEKKVGE